MLTGLDVELLLYNMLITYAVALPLRVGMLSIGPVAFAGLGAYCFALVAVHTGIPAVVIVLMATALCVLAALVIAFPLAKVSGLFAAIASLALVVICTSLESGFGFTGSSLGIVGIPAGGTSLALGLLVLASAGGWLWLDRSQTGRRLDAVRADPVLAATSGISVIQYRFWTIVASAGTAGIAGALYAHSFYLVTPDDFSFLVAVQVSAYAVVAGGVTWIGPAIVGGSLALIPILWQSGGNYSLMLTGLLMAAVLTLYPSGLGGALRRHVPGRNLTPRRVSRSQAVSPAGKQDAEHAPSIELTDVSKSFGGVRALSGVNFSIHGTGVVGIIGPNGSGKSTMLAIISGLLQADRGTVCINGQRMDRGGPLAFSRAGIARSFQHPRLVPDLRVWENMAVGAHQRRPEAVISLIADQMELSDATRKWPDQVTLSEQRRAEVGRSLASGARIMLLDEPAAGLTDLEADHLAKLLRQLGQDRLIVIVEHNVELIGRVAPRLLALVEGSLVADGSPQEIWRNEIVRRAYLGTHASPQVTRKVARQATQQAIGKLPLMPEESA